MRKRKVRSEVSIMSEILVLNFLEPVKMNFISFQGPLNVQGQSLLIKGRLDIVHKHSDVFGKLIGLILIETHIEQAQVCN